MISNFAPLRTRQHTMSANEDVTKAIASFYQGDSDTAFLDLSYYYTCQLFLSQMREIFTLS